MTSPTQTSPARSLQDVAALAAIVLVGLAISVRALLHHHQPYEDAAMLMRYTVNVAHGHGVVFNPHGPHVDGATDLLFMLLAAVPVALGASVRVVYQFLEIASMLISAVAAYGVARWKIRLNLPLSFGLGLAFVVGPAAGYVALGFAAAFMGLMALLCWWLCERWLQAPSRATGVAVGVSIILLGLARPEGVFLGVFLALAAASRLDRASRRSALTPVVTSLLAVGIVYFAARWIYFGYPLPNPFYVKFGGSLHLAGFKQGLKFIVNTAPIELLIAAVGLAFAETRAVTVRAFGPVAGFLVLWLLVSDETNYIGRFQYPAFALSVFAAAVVLGALRDAGKFDWAFARTTTAALASAAVALTLFAPAAVYALDTHRPRGFKDDRALAGSIMRSLGTDHSAAVSEAGLIPLISGWNSIDTWGLNDKTLAHHFDRLPELLAQVKPDLIMFHAPFDYAATAKPWPPNPDPSYAQRWTDMEMIMDAYARDHHYVLASARTDHRQTWVYWVRCGGAGDQTLATELHTRLTTGKVDESPASVTCTQASD